jgi:AraC family transcriptional regulator
MSKENKIPTCRFYGKALAQKRIAGFTLSESVYSAGQTLPKHSHAHNTFCLVLHGGFVQSYGNTTLECGPSTFLVCPPGEIHSDNFNDAIARCFIIEATPQWVDRIREHSLILDSSASFNKGPITWLAARLYGEFRLTDELSPLAIEGLALEIVAEASRCSGEQGSLKAPRWLSHAKELLHERYSEGLTLSEIAESVGVHQVHLARVFRRYFHCSIGEYVRRLRIEYACRRLSASRDPIVDVALEAGFSHQSHFTTTFKQVVGMSPARYRALFDSR